MAIPPYDPSRFYTADKEAQRRKDDEARARRPWERKKSALRRMTGRDILLILGLVMAAVVLLFVILTLLD